MSLNTRRVKSVGLGLLLLAMMATGTIASATPLDGQLNFSGTAVVSLFGIDFIPPVGGGTGQIVVLPGGNLGDYSVFNSGIFVGDIDDRDETTQGAGVPLNIPNWITLPMGYSFQLEFVQPGGFPSADCNSAPANGQQCTIPPFDPGTGTLVSPYNLANFNDTTGGLDSSASFTVNGTAFGNGESAAFEGVLNATYELPYQDLINALMNGESVTMPFSATLIVTSSAVPEPSSLVLGLGGAALIGAGLLRRRKS